MTERNAAPDQPAICDYEGSTYRVDFWEGKGRDYEDAVERAALRRLLPRHARRYVDFGAGFGRLINEAARYDHVVVLDYSRTMLQDAQARLGRDPRYTYVAADLYRLPFAPNTFDAGILCRVIHHLEDAPAALRQIRGCFAPGGTFVLEFANKLNLKAIARYVLRRQTWSPFDHAPVEFVRLNFDFHPAYIHDALRGAGFAPRRRLGVSWLRLGLLKRALPLGVLVALDRLLQPLGSAAPLAPSLFVQCLAPGAAAPLAPAEAMFRCPQCGHTPLARQGDALPCPACGARWPVRDGIHDFKEPLAP
ncbi:MAG: class I SAM-dependent methyltransferase [Anaerolineae bacterium]|nr:class I SAM-dependent methyltransferase [Anaerolineae bacterium]